MQIQRFASRLYSMLAPGQALLRGIVFDLDGTLTIPCLDFKKLKNQLQIDDHVDVLGYVGTLCDEERKKAMQIIADFEAEGRNNLKLQPGLDDLFRYIGEETKLKLAVLTRNNMNGVEHFLSKCKEFGLSYVRQDIFSIVSFLLSRARLGIYCSLYIFSWTGLYNIYLSIYLPIY